MRLMECADRIRNSKYRNIKAIDYLEANNDRYELRKRGVKREKHQEVNADGKPVNNCYFPHIAITASGYARTWKMLKRAQVRFQSDSLGEVWERNLLPILERALRERKTK